MRFLQDFVIVEIAKAIGQQKLEGVRIPDSPSPPKTQQEVLVHVVVLGCTFPRCFPSSRTAQ